MLIIFDSKFEFNKIVDKIINLFCAVFFVLFLKQMQHNRKFTGQSNRRQMENQLKIEFKLTVIYLCCYFKFDCVFSVWCCNETYLARSNVPFIENRKNEHSIELKK